MAFFSFRKPETITVHAFSSTHGKLAHELVTNVEISQAFDPKGDTTNLPGGRSYRALWDTGATGSCITSKVAGELGLAVIGKSVCSHAQGSVVTSRYLVNIVLPNQVGVAEISATEAILDAGIDVLIGMDIITLGDFAISNRGGKTHFTFRTPSCERICFIEEGKRKQEASAAIERPTVSGPMRNSPCPCGSGKKFKRCCGIF
jgi:uncharacterized protein YchJ